MIKSFADFVNENNGNTLPIKFWIAVPDKQQLVAKEDVIGVDKDPEAWLKLRINDYDIDTEVRRYQIGDDAVKDVVLTSERKDRYKK